MELTKKVIAVIASLFLLVPAFAIAQVTTHGGGTGVVDIAAGSIPFGSVYNLRIGTSTALQFSNSLSRLTYTYGSTTALTISGTAYIGSLTGVLKATSGLVTTATAGSDYENPLTFTYPLTRSTNTISTAFSTTTNNGMSQGFLYSGSGGIWQTAASSSLFGYTPVPPTRNINTTYPLSGGGALSGDLTLTFSGLGTSSPWTAGQVAYVSNGNTVASVATGTVSAGSSAITVTAGRSVIGGSLSIDCAASSGSQNGCLSSTDWTTFNNKIGWGQATSTSANQIVYTNALGKLVSAASSSLSLPNAALQNSSVTINSTSVSLGGSITVSSTTLLTNTNTWTGTNAFAAITATNATTTGTLYVTGPFASTTKFFANGLTSCNGASNAVTFDGAGTFGCNSIAGTAFPFTPTTNFGVNTNATSTIINFTAGLFASSTSRMTELLLGSSTPQAYTNAPFVITGNVNSYTQSVLQNLSNGTNASACNVVQNDLGTNTSYYGELCINSSGYSQAAFASQNLGDVSLLANDGSLVLSAASSTAAISDIRFTTAGTASTSIRMLINKSGQVGIATTSPWALLSVNANGLTYPAFAIGSTTSTLFAVNAAGGIQVKETQPATSTTITLDWASTPQQINYRIGVAAVTITVINATTSQYVASTKRVWICNPATTAGALTWAGVEGFSSGIPTQTTTANQCDRYLLEVASATSSSAYKVFISASTGAQ